MQHQSRSLARPDSTGCCPYQAPECRVSPQKQTQQVFREKTPPPQVECVYSRDPTPEVFSKKKYF